MCTNSFKANLVSGYIYFKFCVSITSPYWFCINSIIQTLQPDLRESKRHLLQVGCASTVGMTTHLGLRKQKNTFIYMILSSVNSWCSPYCSSSGLSLGIMTFNAWPLDPELIFMTSEDLWQWYIEKSGQSCALWPIFVTCVQGMVLKRWKWYGRCVVVEYGRVVVECMEWLLSGVQSVR